MSIASSIIAYIDDVFPRIWFHKYKFVIRSLKSLLICDRNMGIINDDAHLESLFGMFHRAVDQDDYDQFINETQFIAEEMMDLIRTSQTITLTLDDVVGIADCFLENTIDLRGFSVMHFEPVSGSLMENIAALEVQMSWCLKNLLSLAMRCGTSALELEDLLLQIQPAAICAAGLFLTTDAYDFKWLEVVESNCVTLHRLATSPQLYQTYTLVLKRFKSSINLGMDSNDDDTLNNVLDYLVALLWDVLRLDIYDHSVFEKIQLKLLYERLRFLRNSLKKLPCGKFRDEIGVLVCDSGILMFSRYHTDVPADPGLLSDLLQIFDDIVQTPWANELIFGDSTNIVEDMETNVQISDGMKEGDALVMEKETELQSRQPLGGCFPVVGFKEDELNSILDQLTGGISKKLRMVAISGMAGVGKTTLALKIFNIASVRYNFQAFAWCTFSQVLDKKKVFIQLLNQIHGSSSYSGMAVDDLANKLRQSLKGKKYLILLDDVWTNEAWNSVETSFPDDFTQSRIILTSRQHSVAPRGLLVTGESHSLRLREDHECLEILKSKLFPETEWPIELAEFGEEISAECKGLPLTATIVAGLLAATRKEDWKRILDDLSSGVVSGAEQCNNSIELSYNYLPDELRLCFLYFGAYPEDHMVPVKELIRLWMAEGFIKSDSLKRIEDIARGYLNMLVERNLIMISQRRSIGGAKTCRIHDVLHEFCRKRAKHESFFHLLSQRYDQLSNFNESSSLQRLCIHSKPNHFVKSRLFCPSAHSVLFFLYDHGEYEPHLFDMSFIIQIFKLAQVLYMGQIQLLTEIPSEMQLLTQLKYLSISCIGAIIPSWIGELSNLETFIVDMGGSSLLPDTFWNLQKLKYFHILTDDDFYLPFENLENSLVLLELETLIGVVFDCNSMEKQMRKFPNIRRLKFDLQFHSSSIEEFVTIVIPDFLSQLESLTIRCHYKSIFEFGSTENIRKVHLRSFKLSRDNIAVIGNLPNLEILKLESVSFLEDTLHMEEGEFLRLKVLELFDELYNLKRWTASDEQLPNLQELKLKHCLVLEEIPSCLENISTLEKINVHECSTTVESLVRDIEMVYTDFGNPIVVRIKSFEKDLGDDEEDEEEDLKDDDEDHE